jgi:hypothetical protein
MELIGQACSSARGCKLALSLSHMQARPPLLQPYGVCASMALARPQVRESESFLGFRAEGPRLKGVRSLWPHCSRGWGRGWRPRGALPVVHCGVRQLGDCGWAGLCHVIFCERRAPSAEREYPGWRSTFRSVPNVGCPTKNLWERGWTDNSNRMGPSEFASKSRMLYVYRRIPLPVRQR